MSSDMVQIQVRLPFFCTEISPFGSPCHSTWCKSRSGCHFFCTEISPFGSPCHPTWCKSSQAAIFCFELRGRSRLHQKRFIGLIGLIRLMIFKKHSRIFFLKSRSSAACLDLCSFRFLLPALEIAEKSAILKIR